MTRIRVLTGGWLPMLAGALAVGLASGCAVAQRRQPLIDLQTVAWAHGAANCATATEPAIQVVRYDARTWILRQNKCLDYEAPFMFLLLGNQKALLLDTGATSDSIAFPLYRTVRRLLAAEAKPGLELVVAHTHNHGDHRAADGQFRNQPRVRLVGLEVAAVQQFFGFRGWPSASAAYDLGGRRLEIIPIPGHEAASIAVYDPATRWLLTGDTVYPGRLYVRDWPAFRASIQRLVDFTTRHPVAYVVGNHIEMTRTAGIDYPTGTTYQPNEHPLPLQVAGLQRLNQALRALGDTPARKVDASFIIDPK